MGHLHVVCYKSDIENTVLVPGLAASEIIKHFSPWNHLVQQKLEHGIRYCIKTMLDQSLVESPSQISVNLLDRKLWFPNGAVARQEGYTVDFSRGVELKWILVGLMDLAAKFEAFYRELADIYALAQGGIYSLEWHETCKKRILDAAQRFGFPAEASESLVDFMAKIKPTFGQIITWERAYAACGEIGVFDRILRLYGENRRRLTDGRFDSDDVRLALIRETYLHPQRYAEINNTWPVHLSASYLVDDFRLHDGDIWVHSLKLFPGIGSSISATERVLGTVINR